MSLLLRLKMALVARRVGADQFGNTYHEGGTSLPGYGRPRRWVMYAGDPDPTMVPPEWHAWLHFTTDSPLPAGPRLPWQKPHQPNRTGTPDAWRPAGHDSRGGRRQRTGGDYEAWTPGDTP